ncbi:MAG: ATP-binding cassette domain-containing protein [Anaerolineae bacterium]|nr:ATP-binding cassette domain-containing protein [Anaerolineae bacterium]
MSGVCYFQDAPVYSGALNLPSLFYTTTHSIFPAFRRAIPTIAFEEYQLSGIVGPNGAGKTTLFNILTGEHHPTPFQGQIIFDGKDITRYPRHRVAQLGIARSFQMMNLFDDFTALENIMVALPQVRGRKFNMRLNVPTDDTIQDEAYSVLQHISLQDVARKEARNLSYGNRRALEIGVALASKPRMLFLDEPTQGLGSDQMSKLIELIQKLKSEVTIVVIEHDMDFLTQIADVISVMLWGQIIATDTPVKLLQNRGVLK